MQEVVSTDIGEKSWKDKAVAIRLDKSGSVIEEKKNNLAKVEI